MPRDLSTIADENALQGMPRLTTAEQLSPLDDGTRDSKYSDMLDDELGESATSKRDELHPYTQTLTLSDIDSCIRLEDAAFPPHERATPEKFAYRLKCCSLLCMGIFTSQTNSTLPTAESSAPVTSSTPERKAILLGHIVSTMTTNPTVTDSDMAIPTASNPDPSLGHKELGRTVCLHSLAVLPEYQGRKLGATLMLAYLSRMKEQRVADRVALIAHDHLVPFYERLGFVNKGQSAAQFGGGGWYDMVNEFNADP